MYPLKNENLENFITLSCVIQKVNLRYDHLKCGSFSQDAEAVIFLSFSNCFYEGYQFHMDLSCYNGLRGTQSGPQDQKCHFGASFSN